MTSQVGHQGSLQFVTHCAGNLQLGPTGGPRQETSGDNQGQDREERQSWVGARSGSRPLKALCATRSSLSKFRQHRLVEWLTNHVPGVQLLRVTEG